MNGQPALDVSGLPDHAYGQRSILWWATLGFCLIEGTAFALALVSAKRAVLIEHRQIRGLAR